MSKGVLHTSLSPAFSIGPWHIKPRATKSKSIVRQPPKRRLHSIQHFQSRLVSVDMKVTKLLSSHRLCQRKPLHHGTASLYCHVCDALCSHRLRLRFALNLIGVHLPNREVLRLPNSLSGIEGKEGGWTQERWRTDGPGS